MYTGADVYGEIVEVSIPLGWRNCRNCRGGGFYCGRELIERAGLDERDRSKVCRLVFGMCRGCEGMGIVKDSTIWDRVYMVWSMVNRFSSRWIEVRMTERMG